MSQTIPSAPPTPAGTLASEPAVKLDPRTFKRGLSCVHCGLCLPVCPTFTQTGHEADSPRGRIQLMMGLATGDIQPTPSVRHHLDLCLDCRACESACPSSVVYHELIEETRQRFAEMAPPRGHRRLMQAIFYNVFVYPTRLKLALLPARIMQRLGIYAAMRKSGLFQYLPEGLQKMEQMLPQEGRLWPKTLPERTPRGTGVQPVKAVNPNEGSSFSEHRQHGLEARATRNVTVGFFAGCIGSVMFDEVNRKAVELLSAAGAEVFAPRKQVCCGAIHHHSGSDKPAKAFAKQNIDAFIPEKGEAVDFIATNIAGCGAMLREYDHLLRDNAKYAQRAKEFVKRVRDISEVLVELGLPEMRHRVEANATYHDACHLAHAQRVTAAPRKLLAQVPGLTMVPLPDSDMCCGAAGTYNLEHPDMSTKLAERKLNNIDHTGAEMCITGNVGCAMQIQSEAQRHGKNLRVLHPVEVLHQAVFGNG